MSTQDNITVIEDEPYTGLFLGKEREAEAAASGFNIARGFAASRRGARAEMSDPQALADILRSTREAIGYSLDQVADITRVRRSYLEAFEQCAYDQLPSRPFAIGYVKAYAKALSLDEEALADLFKRSQADPTAQALRAPVGAAFEDLKPNYRYIIIAVAVLLLGVIVWNVVQRAPETKADPLTGNRVDSWSVGMPVLRDEAVLFSQPAPAPKDQDIPIPYYTPGLEEGFAAIDAERAQTAVPGVEAVPLQMRKAFNPRGAVFGNTSDSSVTIQAKKSVNLVLRSPQDNGLVYFARQLGAGEAYRIPNVSTVPMVVDVSDPNAFEIYHNGEFAGDLYADNMSISQINAKAAATARLMDAQPGSRPVGSAAPSQTPAAPAEAPATNPVDVLTQPQLDRKPDAPLPYIPAQPVTPPADATPVPQG